MNPIDRLHDRVYHSWLMSLTVPVSSFVFISLPPPLPLQSLPLPLSSPIFNHGSTLHLDACVACSPVQSCPPTCRGASPNDLACRVRGLTVSSFPQAQMTLPTCFALFLLPLRPLSAPTSPSFFCHFALFLLPLRPLSPPIPLSFSSCVSPLFNKPADPKFLNFAPW